MIDLENEKAINEEQVNYIVKFTHFAWRSDVEIV
jgi:hypothetical protein